MTELFDQYDYTHQRIQNSLVLAYLKEGSVNAILPQFPEVPEQTAHNWLDAYDIVKLQGRKPNPLGSVLYFLSQWVAAKDIPLERWYREYTPYRIREALSTPSLHRVVDHIRRLTTRLSATALIITPQDAPEHILVGHDITTPNPQVGKTFGSLSLPMTYSNTGEPPQLSIKRVLQQEVFSNLVLSKDFPDWLVPDELQPFMHVAVADVDVAAYHLQIPWELTDSFSSPKLDGLKLTPLDQLLKHHPLDTSIRSGVVEIASGHSSYINQPQTEPITWTLSRLNEEILLARL